MNQSYHVAKYHPLDAFTYLFEKAESNKLLLYEKHQNIKCLIFISVPKIVGRQ